MQKMAEEHKNRCDELLEEYKEVSLALDHIKKSRNLVSSTIVFTRLSSLSNDIDVFKEKVYQEFANKEKTAEMERRMQKKLNEPNTFAKLDKNMNSKESDEVLKIVIAGQDKVGKSKMVSRCCEDEFNETYTPTIGIDFRIQVFQINDKKVKLQIWDTAGQERFRSFSYAYYCAASCMIFAYDITDKSSLD